MGRSRAATRVLRALLLSGLGLIAAINVIYFATNYKEETKTLRKLEQAVVSKASSAVAGRRQLVNPPADDTIDEVFAGVAEAAFGKGQPSEAVALSTIPKQSTKAYMYCADVWTDCKKRALSGECGMNMTVGMHMCKKTCNSCSMLAAVISRQMGYEVEEVMERQCEDTTANCASYVDQGLCASRPDRMLAMCKRSCGFCSSKPPSGAGPTCQDDLDVCPFLATHRKLCSSADHVWMTSQCINSCELCPGVPHKVHLVTQLKELAPETECEDYHAECQEWASNGKCSYNNGFMSLHCPKACNYCQSRRTSSAGYGYLAPAPVAMPAGVTMTGITHTGQLKVVDFMTAAPAAGGATSCVDSSTSCGGWAQNGECIKNPTYMLKSCPVSCKQCGGSIYLPDPLAQVQLSNGVMMPTVGFGTAGLADQTQEVVLSALQAGYTHIDSAQAREWYREDLVGQAIAASGVKREQLFITSKIHPKNLGYTQTLEVFEQSLGDLNTTYIDLLLLHYASCWPGLAGCSATSHEAGHTWKDSWSALQELYQSGRVRAIGVSNFNEGEVQELLRIATVKPHVLQAHMDPLSQNQQLVSMCRKSGIQFEAYSSLGTQWPRLQPGNRNPVLSHSTILAIANSLGKTPAQVVLRWVLQNGVVVLPRSSNKERMAQNLDLFSFSLSEDHMKAIAILDGSQPR
mmetsp:Transcript_20930/g.45770  ORF Transcript_20930/g.45770 Transcript_20930/m.45770 type:complete len:687 (+) Transcript_20930:117-2177(+)|eukprot:CAMPEP_0202908968 /NCGR_PEP_ID=MMETSP1392-20130828/47778_1 /ASSEMBLY_ACC=CAM_ASM_000868 /TAXON_ID=225041 /ORGANISM="Chlamydomonas chlamydogama, Strain SAG 11-48b" /LENGTH=686 /DNA_ID=CAMNT_0049598531 /DNA_START=63 /DNA_END=2123 /DNA_ORIENTATION=-